MKKGRIVIGTIGASVPKMSAEEVRKYYETIKGSARISEVKKAYKRSRDKKVSDYE